VPHIDATRAQERLSPDLCRLDSVMPLVNSLSQSRCHRRPWHSRPWHRRPWHSRSWLNRPWHWCCFAGAIATWLPNHSLLQPPLRS